MREYHLLPKAPFNNTLTTEIGLDLRQSHLPATQRPLHPVEPVLTEVKLVIDHHCGHTKDIAIYRTLCG